MKKTKLLLGKKLNLVKETITTLDQRSAEQIAGGATIQPASCTPTLCVSICPTACFTSNAPVCCVGPSNTCDTLQQSCGGACPVPTLGCP
ncbi:class I lanthipeptide [Taibaiella koreensis]|uniref:class I lanthipeptide n=1 Tax=Taibaiella koreensis TaxID=1268548 RepID=UPI0013C2AA4E|nr:class I lanthipeptide [Taibaiella koreensis]